VAIRASPRLSVPARIERGTCEKALSPLTAAAGSRGIKRARLVTMVSSEWSCRGEGPEGDDDSGEARWAHAEVFDALSESSSTAPVTIELDYYRCKMQLREVVEEALGISVGNAALVYILTSVICVHALVRALGKCGAVRFRNGRFISPVVLDEYLERKSVDAVLRQEREKETEETDPFL
jgi:hypothetical protein